MKSKFNRFLGASITAAALSSPIFAADLVWTSSNPDNTVWTAAGV